MPQQSFRYKSKICCLGCLSNHKPETKCFLKAKDRRRFRQILKRQLRVDYDMLD